MHSQRVHVVNHSMVKIVISVHRLCITNVISMRFAKVNPIYYICNALLSIKALTIMKSRIQSIIQHHRLTPSRFADQIGVQRSAVSHILSGRNNPGLDFLAKILDNYPDISGDWLITGKGEMLKKKVQKPAFAPTLFSTEPSDVKDSENQAPYHQAARPIIEPLPESPKPEQAKPESVVSNQQNTTKTIARIVIFYDDRSFESYQP